MDCKEEKEYQVKQEYDYEKRLRGELGFALEELNALTVVEDIKRLHKQLNAYGWYFEPSELCEALWELG